MVMFFKIESFTGGFILTPVPLSIGIERGNSLKSSGDLGLVYQFLKN